MRARIAFVALPVAAGILAWFGIASAQSLPAGFADSVVVRGLDHPAALEFAPRGRLLIADQLSARVLLWRPLAPAVVETLLAVPNVVVGGEEGLVGLALDPDFPARPYLYTHQTDAGGHIRLSRWTLSGDLAGSGDGVMQGDPASRFDVIADAPNASPMHNGGTLRFGPDGMLYASLGDDRDPCAAQDSSSLHGAILRLDVHALPAGPGLARRADITPRDNPFAASPDSNARLVLAYGLRNPFRFGIDAERGWLAIGDVGESSFEEIDVLALPGGAAGAAAPGANFGWPWLEGDAPYTTCAGPPPASVPPVFTLDRRAYTDGAAIVSGGFCRTASGGALAWPAEYDGDLFFGEYYSGALRRLKWDGSAWAVAPAVAGQADSSVWAGGYEAVSDWRFGPDGSLWYCQQYDGVFEGSGRIGCIVVPPAPAAAPVADVPRVNAAPVPSRGSVNLTYTLTREAVTSLALYGVRGRLERRLQPREWRDEGPQSVAWDGRDESGHRVSAGIYWARLEVGGRVSTTRLVLLH